MRLSVAERDESATTARRLLSDRSTSEKVRSLLADPLGHDPELLAEMVDLGWGASHLPEVFGGYGVSLGDTYPVFSELGRSMVGGPLVTSAVVAGGTLAAAPNQDLAGELGARLVEGSRIVTVAMAGPQGHYTDAGLGMSAVTSGGALILSGVASFVPDALIADEAIVFASTNAGVVAVVVELRQRGAEVTPIELVDRTRRMGTVSIESLRVDPSRVLAPVGDGAALLETCVDLGATTAAIDSFGVGELVLEQLTGYVKERHQFGRPIGSFQAIKHRLADAVLLVETSRVAIADAAEAVSPCDPAERRSRIVSASTAKSYVGDAMARICKDALQTYGGIGFTFEHDMHLQMKRVLLNQSMYGSSSWHRRRIADVALAPFVGRPA